MTTHPPTAPGDRRTVAWAVALCAAALVFDGYDLVVYGTVVPVLLGDPSQLGALTPAAAGRLGSYALVGVLVGALAAGAVADRIGRRRVVLVNLVWFSVGMGATATTHSVAAFGIGRFLTGIGIGALVATVGALVAELAPAGQRNRFNAVVYSGIPAGGVLAALVALVLDDVTGWRGLFWVGALPIVVLFPLALLKLPESPKWLAERGRPRATREPVGFAALASRRYGPATLLLGTMSFAGLLLTYGLNTWLPEIMGQNGYGKDWALTFLLVLNGGAIVGGLLASTAADRLGARSVVVTTFLMATVALLLLPLGLPLGVLVLAVAVAGIGTIGTQVLVYGLVSNYYPTSARGAGVAWCAGFGRLGGILGPVIGGALVGAGLGGGTAFRIFAAVAVAGAVVTLLVPRSRAEEEAAPVAGQDGLAVAAT
ncbi:MFS transporter [Nocardioides kongjuensis]|uniref:AAHS family benzoate transporter-like MFS transporter n=1 Tax=Nocardioides kongjuensis TaxID=349522 RepID=A0A852RRU2_9ACTN|nr:MFS transporter [Nocardioides kongjuensis]NYD33449.1 AAHS family benzoate transporter-like MFS transporter [Nocardioides kongjuensis]